jgi:diguanylate cyclase (GGDEF)-like protein/PAS domain S-box-containing protein
METLPYESMIDHSPMAFAYHRIILDEAGKPCDYVFLRINPAFEEMTGLTAEIIGKRVTEVLPNIGGEAFDYIAAYGAISLDGGTVEFEEYMEALGRWYRIQAYSPEKYCFVVNFLDVTKERKQVEEHARLMRLLQENELQFHRIIDNLPFSLSIVALDGTIRYSNPLGFKLFELEEADLSNQTTLPIWIHPEERLRFTEAVQKNGLIKDWEMHLRTMRGKELWAMGSAMMIDYQGEPCTLSTHHDITERKEMEEILRESEEKFRLIFEHAAESILVVQDNRIQICNSVTQTLTGYNEDELLLIPFDELVSTEDRSFAAHNYRIRMADKKNDGKQQYRIVKKNGEKGLVEMNGVHILWNGLPAIQYFVIDITEQKRAELALKASEEKYRLITDFASDVIWVFNYSKWAFTYVSPSIHPLLGYQPEEAMQANLDNLVTSDALEQIKRRFPQRLRDLKSGASFDEPYIAEIQNLHRNGHYIWVETSSKYRYNAEGEVEIVGVTRNIEERKRAEREIVYLSYHDQLTGLYNRRFYEMELQRLDTEQHLPVSFILADVNGLKMTNDAFGHMTGDQMLIRIAALLQGACRTDDVIARVGGDEFVILLPRTDREQAERIIRHLERTLSEERNEFMIFSVSFGSATKDSAEQKMTDVFLEAENAMYTCKLRDSNQVHNETVKRILDTLYAKSPAEETHNRQVSELSRTIAVALGLGEELVQETAAAALIHDIGKISLSDRVLFKEEPLTEEEWMEFRRHPERGYQILKSATEYASLAPIILSHHERMDGKGFPKGLSGEAIPLPSRILAVADAYDSMTCPRGNQTRLSPEEALKELFLNAGTQFDQDVVRAFAGTVSRGISK